MILYTSITHNNGTMSLDGLLRANFVSSMENHSLLKHFAALHNQYFDKKKATKCLQFVLEPLYKQS